MLIGKKKKQNHHHCCLFLQKQYAMVHQTFGWMAFVVCHWSVVKTLPSAPQSSGKFYFRFLTRTMDWSLSDLEQETNEVPITDFASKDEFMLDYSQDSVLPDPDSSLPESTQQQLPEQPIEERQETESESEIDNKEMEKQENNQEQVESQQEPQPEPEAELEPETETLEQNQQQQQQEHEHEHEQKEKQEIKEKVIDSQVQGIDNSLAELLARQIKTLLRILPNTQIFDARDKKGKVVRISRATLSASALGLSLIDSFNRFVAIFLFLFLLIY